MDIHKPKPWRGVREFLKEYVIIVVGVMTALGAEQGAEWLHWRHLTQQNMARLHQAAEGAALWSLEHNAIGGCVRGGLDGLTLRLRRPGGDWKGVNPGATGPVSTWLPPAMFMGMRQWPHTAWESALSSGVLVHLPTFWATEYGRIFDDSNAMREQQQIASSLMAELAPLALDQTLTVQDKAHYLTVISQLEGALNLEDSIATNLLIFAAEDGFWPRPSFIARVIPLDRATRGACVRDLDRETYRKMPSPR